VICLALRDRRLVGHAMSLPRPAGFAERRATGLMVA
jgi:hypothetical protein